MKEKIKYYIFKLLRRSEEYTKTDMVYLARGSFWLTLGQIVSTLSGFLLALAFANLLPKEVYGTYKYILSMAAILSIPTLSGLNTAIIQAVARNYEGSLLPALKTRMTWGLLSALGSLGLALYYFVNFNYTLTIAFLIAGVFLPFMDSLTLYDSLLVGRKLFNISSKYWMVLRITGAILLAATLFLTKQLLLIVLAYFIIYTVLRLILFYRTINKYKPNNNQDPETISYGKHLSFIGILSAIADQIDNILVFTYLGAAQLAVYSFAIAIPEQIKALIKQVHILALPKLSTRTPEEIKSTIWGKITKLALAISILTAIYIFIAPLFYKILLPQYTESIFYSQIFAISLISGVAILPYSVLQSLQRKTDLYYYSLFNSLTQVISIFVLIYFFGLWGAIVARVVTRFLTTLFSFYLLKRI